MISQSDLPQFESATVEPRVEPIPPRYWWLKRITIAAGVLLVALFALRLWWGWEANRRLQAEIDRIIAAGEPIYPEDFDPKEDIPDDQNAARLLIGADEAINLTSEQQEVFEKVVGQPDLIRARLDEVRGIVESNSEVFRRLRRARGLPVTDWGMRFRTPALNTSIPSFSDQRKLSKFMSVSATYQHIAGNDGEAVDILRDALAHSEYLSQQQTLIAQLSTWACGALTIQAIEDILPTMSITSKNEDPTQEGGSASRAQVRNLIAELLDERGFREGMRRAMMCERMYQVDILKTLVQGTTTMSALFGWSGPMPASVPDVVWRYALGPALTLDTIAILRETTPFVDAADSASFSGVPETGDDSSNESGFKFLQHPLRSYLSGSLEHAFELYFRLLARRRVAGTALAIRLYEIDFWHRPGTLAELVPEYLPQMLEDPFTEDGEALRYLPNATHPVVYSIGDDGLDEEGNAEEWVDVTFFLDGWRLEDNADDKAPPTSTQAGEDQKNAEEDEGKTDEDGESEEQP